MIVASLVLIWLFWWNWWLIDSKWHEPEGSTQPKLTLRQHTSIAWKHLAIACPCRQPQCVLSIPAWYDISSVLLQQWTNVSVSSKCSYKYDIRVSVSVVRLGKVAGIRMNDFIFLSQPLSIHQSCKLIHFYFLIMLLCVSICSCGHLADQKKKSSCNKSYLLTESERSYEVNASSDVFKSELTVYCSRLRRNEKYIYQS